MDSLETLIRETLDDRAGVAPSADGLLDRVRAAGSPRRRRTPLLAGVAAVLVVALVAVGPTFVGSDPNRLHQAAPLRSSPSPTTAVPAGRQSVSFRGVSLDVPADLIVATVACNLPTRYVLAADPLAGVPSCALGNAPGGGSQRLAVLLNAYDGLESNTRLLSMRPSMVDGLPASIGIGVLPSSGRSLGPRSWFGKFSMVRPGVSITVTASTRAAVANILHSVHLATVDQRGCSAVQPARSYFPQKNRNGPIVPLTPTRVTACQYVRFSQKGPLELLRSLSLSGAEASHLGKTLDGLPAARSSDVAFQAAYILIFRGGPDSPRAVFVSPGTSLVATNGQQTVRDRDLALQNLLNALR